MYYAPNDMKKQDIMAPTRGELRRERREFDEDYPFSSMLVFSVWLHAARRFVLEPIDHFGRLSG